MSEELKVYLDHLIPRENLRYKRPQQSFSDSSSRKHPTLRLGDYLFPDQFGDMDRKPDFQRATWAWSPEDCVELLESVVQNQVVPSIIMWRSPDNGFRYILDGGHRVSVVIAWLRDDWGESQVDQFANSQQAEMVKRAAQTVRALVEQRIGRIDEYEKAAQEIVRLTKEGLNPSEELRTHQDGNALGRGLFYQGLKAGDVSFNILWVNGDYRTAEQSFLKINRLGRQITEWERKLIENRNSSFARLVMSLTSVSSAQHYWPDKIDDAHDISSAQAQVKEILESVRYLDQILFRPEHRKPVNTLTQPLLVANGEKRPFYLAELLTIVKGFRGQNQETEKLLSNDSDAIPEEIIRNGLNHIRDTISVFDNIIGSPNSHDPANKSLELVPLLYFYKSDGAYIRSLLYGFIYWLNQGNDEEIRIRKEIFSAYRGKFEQIYLAEKDYLVQGTGRNIGSGTEVTLSTAVYFGTLLELLVEHKGIIDSEDFLQSYAVKLPNIIKGQKTTSTDALKRRLFSQRQKSTTMIELNLRNLSICEICGGKLDPQRKVQHDHRMRHTHGGETSITNQRVVHPFCNNRRDDIEMIQQGFNVSLPKNYFSVDPNAPVQLVLFEDKHFIDD